uniref:Uncharacterized protein n=1 Tax=Rhizophora mucronata TaxID=61149 RepID=A0A2P2Q609_RHIMU
MNWNQDGETGNNTRGYKPFPTMQLPYNLLD